MTLLETKSSLGTPPEWDMSVVYPSLESAEFAQAFDRVVSDIRDLGSLFEARQVRRREKPEIDAAFVTAYEEVVGHLNALSEVLRTLSAYISCFVTTDANNEVAKARQSELNTHLVPLEQLQTRFVAWVGSSDIDRLLQESEVARQNAFSLRKAREQARHQMREAEENLAAQLRPSSITGWAKLHGNLSALLTATVPLDGEEKVLPMSTVRNLSSHPDRAVRKAAFEAELKAWESVTIPLASTLNGVKGFQQVIRTKRGYADDVEPTLLQNSITRATLEAMQQACVESFPDFRHYLDVKARALGLEKLAWYDIAAPIETASRTYTWLEAEDFIRENFGVYSKRLADFADRSFRERWIDAVSHVGKSGGAYCASLRAGESRVLMNFDGSFMSISTLAHELGHAYHNLNLQERTPLQRGLPSTLAETASIFCETLAFDAALARASREERIALLDTSLQHDFAVVVDIHSRFLFEKAVFEKRTQRDLTVSEFTALMTEAQHATYGENIEPLHPYMWAVKSHYLSTFYNYPYTFGLLFGVGLYAYFRKNPDTFRAQYDDFLSSTGMADATELAKRFGIDIEDVAFWRSSLDVSREQITEFESLLASA